MLEVKVKTLDGQNISFDDIPDTLTVRQFKEKIADSIAISADTQRLIFQGRVLQDEKLLKDYDVNGKVIHVVVRPPPSTGRPGSDRQPPSSTTGSSGSDVNSIVVGSFTLPSDILDANTVQNIAQEAIRNLGDLGRNARVSTRSNSDGSAVDVHIHLGPVNTGQTVSEAQRRLNTASQMLTLAREAINQLENPDGANNSGGSSTAPASQSDSVRDGEANREGGASVTTETVGATSNLSESQSPMDTSDSETVPASNTEGQSTSDVGSTQSTTESTASANQTTGSSSSSQSNNDSQGTGSQPPRGRPNITALGDVLVEMAEVNRRLQPHIERFTRIVQTDPEMDPNEQRDNQLVCNTVLEAMHAMSHSYHAISDLMVDVSQQRPRLLYVTLAIPHPHTHVIQQTVPVQIQVPINPLRHQRRSSQPNAGARNTGTSRSSSTSTTGTSTIPRPTTTETGTQPTASVGTQPTVTVGTQPTATTGTSPDPGHLFPEEVIEVTGVIEEEDLMHADVESIASQMTAGLQNVLGQGGLQQGDGTPENPYVFVQMGPETVTVSQISTQVVTSSESRSSDTPTTAGNSTPESTPSPSTGAGTQPTSTTAGPQPGPVPPTGLPNLPANLIQGIMSQIMQQAGAGSPQRFQINIGHQGPPGTIPMMGMHRAGPAGIPIRLLGQHGQGFRLGTPQQGSGTQSAGARAGQAATSGTQTNAAGTSTFGTQTAGSAASQASSTQTTMGSSARTTPSSTSGTQTGPRAATFIMPGAHGGPGGLTPLDPNVPCSSRHFLTRNAQNAINQSSPQTGDSALADVVTNLMSELLGVNTPATQPASTATTTSTSTSQPGDTSSQPRPSGPTFHMRAGPIHNTRLHFNNPPNLASMFPGRMPLLPGVRFRIGTPPGAPSGSTGPQPASQTSAGPRPAATGTSSGGSTTGGEPAFLQTLRNLLQTSGLQPPPSTDRNQNIETSANQQQQQQQQQPISDEAFTQLVGNITNYMTQAAMGQAPRQTIGDFLGNLGDSYHIPQGEGFINDVFSCVVSQLAITDLLQVFAGQASPLNRTQEPLRQFLADRVLQGEQPTSENIHKAVEVLVEKMRSEIQDTVAAATPLVHVDFEATLYQFLSQQFFNIVSLIMNSRANDELFGRDLYSCVRRFLGELFVLCSRCLGGMAQVQNLVSQRLRSLSQGVNPAIQDWMGTMTIRQMDTFLPSITVNEGEISYYIVYKDAKNSSNTDCRPKPSTSTAPAMASASGAGLSAGASRDSSGFGTAAKTEASNTDGEKEKRKSPMQPMELSSPTSSPGAAEMVVEKERSPGAVKGAASSATETSKSDRVKSSGTVRAPLSPRQQQPTTPAGAEAADTEWRSVIPQEWVPVIERDIQTQRSQPPQRPHSDVYLQGMPPKRRRLMTTDRPADLSNSQETMTASLQRAVAAAGVEPISSLENLTSEIARDTELQAAFDDHVTNAVSQRLEGDSDYKSERFPHTEDYYHKNSYTKK